MSILRREMNLLGMEDDPNSLGNFKWPTGTWYVINGIVFFNLNSQREMNLMGLEDWLWPKFSWEL